MSFLWTHYEYSRATSGELNLQGFGPWEQDCQMPIGWICVRLLKVTQMPRLLQFVDQSCFGWLFRFFSTTIWTFCCWFEAVWTPPLQTRKFRSRLHVKCGHHLKLEGYIYFWWVLRWGYYLWVHCRPSSKSIKLSFHFLNIHNQTSTIIIIPPLSSRHLHLHLHEHHQILCRSSTAHGQLSETVILIEYLTSQGLFYDGELIFGSMMDPPTQ